MNFYLGNYLSKWTFKYSKNSKHKDVEQELNYLALIILWCFEKQKLYIHE